MNCPRCHYELSEKRVAVISVKSCEHCGGLWCRQLDLPILLHCDSAEIQQLVGEEEAAELGPIHCPQHGGVIGRLCSSVSTGLVFDICFECEGVWLDGGELEALSHRRFWDF